MASFVKLTKICDPKPGKSYIHLNSPEEFHQMLENSHHEPHPSYAKLPSKHLSKIPTHAEYKAIIHSSQCPLEDILRKAPEILKDEVSKLISQLPPERQPLSSYVVTTKAKPSEYRQRTCVGCSEFIKHYNMRIAEQAAKALEKEKAGGPKKKQSSINIKKRQKELRDELIRKKNNNYSFSDDSEEEMNGNDSDSDSDASLFNLSALNIPPLPPMPDYKVTVDESNTKPTWRFVGLNSKKGSEVQNLPKKTILSGKFSKNISVKTVPDPNVQFIGNANSSGEDRSKSEHICIVNGTPVSFARVEHHKFTHWFGQESMLSHGSKKVKFDIRGYEDSEIEMTLHDGNKLDIMTVRPGKKSDRPSRKKFIGTFIIPKPDDLQQFQFCRSKSGYLIIEKKYGAFLFPSDFEEDEPFLDFDLSHGTISSSSLATSIDSNYSGFSEISDNSYAISKISSSIA